MPFELRVQESADGPQQVGTLEAIKVKVLMLVSSVTRGFPVFLRSSYNFVGLGLSLPAGNLKKKHVALVSFFFPDTCSLLEN